MSNRDIEDCGGLVIIFFILVFILGLFFFAGRVEGSKLKEEAIKLNFAEYNSTNGVWQWKTNSVDNR